MESIKKKIKYKWEDDYIYSTTVTNGSFDSESPLGKGPVDDVNVEGHDSPLAIGS